MNEDEKFDEIFLSEEFDKFLTDIEAHTLEIYKLAEIEPTPENLSISDKVFEELILVYESDYHYPYKTRERYPDFIRWLEWCSK